ncbi:hypothetical protein E4T42_08341 [Aureobasidium subglaciale]|nr:hypothetical protein E4T42_08341 [Aureobasidium subglaciale]
MTSRKSWQFLLGDSELSPRFRLHTRLVLPSGVRLACKYRWIAPAALIEAGISSDRNHCHSLPTATALYPLLRITMSRPPLPPRPNNSQSDRPPPLPARKPSQPFGQSTSNAFHRSDAMEYLGQKFEGLFTNDDTVRNDRRSNQNSGTRKADSAVEYPSHLRPSPTGNFFVTSSPPSCLPRDQRRGYFIGRGCPNDSNLPHDAFWFRHIDVPNFSVCSRCFEYHIRGTNFELDFTGKLEPGQTDAARCMFGHLHMTDRLWPQALGTNDLQYVKMYMEAMARVPNCRGVAGIAGSDSAAGRMKWYQARHDAIPGMIACEACYSANIVGSNFDSRFVLSGTEQPQDITWACDIPIPYINRALSEYEKSNDWLKFVAAANTRLSKPPCNGMAVVNSSSRNWYGTSARLYDLDVCETCYMDQVCFTTFESDFGPKSFKKDLFCDLAIPPLKVAYGAALGYEKNSIFWDTCRVQSQTPLCKSSGMTGVQWYTIKGGCDNFDICPTCYTGWICAFRMESFFEPQKPVPAGTTKGCDFSLESQKIGPLIIRYLIATDMPDREQLFSHIRRTSSLSLCTGIKQQTARFWRVGLRGDPMSVCPSCYEDVLRDKPLSHIFQQQITPGKHLCDLYSANMRGRWRQVWQASVAQGIKDSQGNYAPDETALAQFIDYRNHRTQVFLQTIPEMNRLEAAAQNRLFQQQRLNRNSNFYNHLNMTASVANGIHYGPVPAYTTTYGNSSVGYGYATPWGVEGAAYGQQANAIASQGHGDFARIAYLEALWKEVE